MLGVLNESNDERELIQINRYWSIDETSPLSRQGQVFIFFFF